MVFDNLVCIGTQRNKKSKLSSQQNFTRKNFPNGVRKLFSRHMRQKCVNRFCNIATYNFPDRLVTFRTVWKLSRPSGNFPHCLEIFQTVHNFPDRLESFPKVWKLSRQIFYCLQYCCNIHILHLCKKSFDTLACMSRKRFTHFWHIYVAKAIYALLAHICRKSDLPTLFRKFWRVKFCRPESFDFLCLCPLGLILT